ncbi:MAG: sporulation protein Cse60 [Meiothermus sp.]|nr:sporulation protein Cse60 [Meiothermus sp.]
MQGLHLKLITANDSDMFQERLNTFVEKLSEDAMIVDIKFATTTTGNQITYSALVQYKSIEEW